MANEDRIRELISAYVDDALSPDERAYVQDRLDRDVELRDYCGELRAVRDAIAELPRWSAPAGCAESILERIARLPAEVHLDSRTERDGAGIGLGFGVDSRDGTNRARSSTAPARRRRVIRVVAWVATAAAAVLVAVLAWPGRTRSKPGEPSMAERSERDSAPGTTDGDPSSVVRNESSTTGDNGGSSRIAPDGRSAVGTPAAAADGARFPERHSDIAAKGPSDKPTVPMHPVAANGGGASGTNREARSPVAPPADAMPAVPFIAMVVDVVLTQEGIDENIFEDALRRVDIPWKNAIEVDATFERSILAQRVFGALGPEDLPIPADGADGRKADHLQLVFLVARGRQFDNLIRDIYDRRVSGDVAAVRLDISFGTNDSALFSRMEKLARETPDVPSSEVSAHPVVMADAMRTRLQSALLSARAKDGPDPALPDPTVRNGADGVPVLPEGGAESVLAMEREQFDVLVVLRSESTARGQEPKEPKEPKGSTGR